MKAGGVGMDRAHKQVGEPEFQAVHVAVTHPRFQPVRLHKIRNDSPWNLVMPEI